MLLAYPTIARLGKRALATLGPVVLGLAIVVSFVWLLTANSHGGDASQQPTLITNGTTNAPEVRVALDLHNSFWHPRQLAYDAHRDGLWFWTSVLQKDGSGDNQLHFYAIAQQQVRSWPLYDGDWSSQLLSGLALAPSGDVWVGWNKHLLDFHPADGTYTRYQLPAQTRYPVPAAITGNLPTDLGIADLAVTSDGAIWLARYAASSLTRFDPATGTFAEFPLPSSLGDPARLVVSPDGHLLFTTNFSVAHPGVVGETIGDFDPATHATITFAQPAHTLAVAPRGDMYTVSDGSTATLARLSAAERAAAEHASANGAVSSVSNVPFTGALVPFAIDPTEIATDTRGRVWMALAGAPDIAVFDPTTGQTQRYQYAAPSAAAFPSRSGAPVSTTPGAVVLTRIVAMATDGEGHLWYVRAGSDQLEEVVA